MLSWSCQAAPVGLDTALDASTSQGTFIVARTFCHAKPASPSVSLASCPVRTVRAAGYVLDNVLSVGPPYCNLTPSLAIAAAWT